MAKDFFDDEYEKHQQEQQRKNSEQPRQNFDDWYAHSAPEKTKSGKKSLYIVLLCIALVACIGLGWLLCAIVQSSTKAPESEAGDILSTVVQYLKDYYYVDISDDEWTDAIEASGTALMQYAGDRFSRLMSPQTYYDTTHPAATAAQSGKVFGLSFVAEEGVGLYVSSVADNSPAFGKLREGDIVLKLSDMRTESGEIPTVGGQAFSELMPGQWTSESVSAILGETDSATFHVLREVSDPSGFETLSFPLKRAAIPVVNPNYNFQFVEFYFGGNLTNVSTKLNKPQGASISTEEIRHLDELPQGTGYVRLKEFMYYTVNDDEVTAADEFAQVMQLFKEQHLSRLVLDLKGNPGGRVDVVSEIAGMLVSDALLTDSQKTAVTKSNGELLITYLGMPKPYYQRQNYYQKSTYFDYFGTPESTCDIVVWTDENSASASELLTGCLLDYKTAVQMGKTTYGKGIAQNVIELPYEGPITTNSGGSTQYPWAFYYTCASYYSPVTGTNIHGLGYTPSQQYDNLGDYAALVSAVNNYWN